MDQMLGNFRGCLIVHESCTFKNYEIRLCPLVLCLGLSSFQTNNEGFDLVSSCDYDVCRVRTRQ